MLDWTAWAPAWQVECLAASGSIAHAPRGFDACTTEKSTGRWQGMRREEATGPTWATWLPGAAWSLAACLPVCASSFWLLNEGNQAKPGQTNSREPAPHCFPLHRGRPTSFDERRLLVLAAATIAAPSIKPLRLRNDQPLLWLVPAPASSFPESRQPTGREMPLS